MDTTQAIDILDTLPDVRRITRYCESSDITLFLRSLENSTIPYMEMLASWNREFELLTSRIPDAEYEELHPLHEELNRIEMERFLVTNSVTGLHHSCTHYRDLLASRALQIAVEELNALGRTSPALPYALISMGSDGREEQTLITDQDYLIVYGDCGESAADDYFLELSGILVERLAQAGFKKCTGDIMPTNQTWRGSLAQWHKRLLSIVRYEFEEYAKNMMDLIVLSDARYVAGDRPLADELITMIREMEHEYFRVLWGMAKAATEMKLALGFLKRLWTESSGEHKGEFNLKLLAWAPLVMNIRILSINQGIPATSTVERIERLKQEGSFSETFARELKDAYQILTKHRILLQINVIKGIQHDSHHLNPYMLPYDERERIRHAIIKIEEVQRIIHSNFSIV